MAKLPKMKIKMQIKMRTEEERGREATDRNWNLSQEYLEDSDEAENETENVKMKPDTKMRTHIEIKIKMLDMGMDMQMQMATNLEMADGGRSLPIRGERRVLPNTDFVLCQEPTLRDVAIGFLGPAQTDSAFSVGTAALRAIRDRTLVINCMLSSVVCRPHAPTPLIFCRMVGVALCA